MMTEMELDYAGAIMSWSLMNKNVPTMNEEGTDTLSTEQLVKLYWKEQGYEITDSSSLGALDIIG
jgi:hypothetical protein